MTKPFFKCLSLAHPLMAEIYLKYDRAGVAEVVFLLSLLNEIGPFKVDHFILERFSGGFETWPPQQLADYQKVIDYQITEGGKKTSTKLPANIQFEMFWKAYPRKENKRGALTSWTRQKLDKCADDVMKGVENHKKTKQWQEGIIPHATTFLNQGRWMDEVGENNGGVVVASKKRHWQVIVEAAPQTQLYDVSTGLNYTRHWLITPNGWNGQTELHELDVEAPEDGYPDTVYISMLRIR